MQSKKRIRRRFSWKSPPDRRRGGRQHGKVAYIMSDEAQQYNEVTMRLQTELGGLW